jgi:hypothetical protein
MTKSLLALLAYSRCMALIFIGQLWQTNASLSKIRILTCLAGKDVVKDGDRYVLETVATIVEDDQDRFHGQCSMK